MKLRLLTDTGSLINEWDAVVFGDPSDHRNQAEIGRIIGHAIQYHRSRQSERPPDRPDTLPEPFEEENAHG